MRQVAMISLATAALLGAGGVAYAQAGPQADRAPELTRAQVQERSTGAFARMDANHDGVLDRADREARQKQVFDQMDADNSGAISFEEFTALREQRQERRAGRRGGDGQGFGRPRPGGRGDLGRVRAADTNRDGSITQAEFASSALARFDRLDVDKDGTIGADERPVRGMMRRLRGAS